MRGSSPVVKLLGGRGAITVVLSRRLMALYILLLCRDCVLPGLCVWGSSSVVKTDWRPSAIRIVLSIV